MNKKDLNNDIDLLIVKKIEGGITPDEETILNNYIAGHPEEKIRLEEFRLIWEKSSKIEIKQKYTADQRWEKLSTQINQKKELAKYRKLIVQALSVAASLFICIFSYFQFEEDITLIANNGEIIRSTLPDKSEVVLNSGSSLIYKENLFSNKRSVTLQGEAFFKVEKKKKPFVVNSDYAQIKVLGTKFNIKNRNSEIKVSCLEGSVNVMNTSYPESQVILKKALSTNFNKDGKPANPFKISQLEINGWTEGIIIFNQTPIIEVFNELERTFNISIKANTLAADITYNGEFNNKEIVEILEIIALSLDLKLIRNDEANYSIE